ncbi:MAG: exodeoxyribonuclease VII large subunit [Anaerolineae bacterium]
MNRPDAYTVSSLTEYIRALFDADLRMQDVWVQGEVSNFTAARSGHWYFTLKDDAATLKCVMWRSSTFKARSPNHGDAVLAHGYMSVYEAGGQYQLYVDQLIPAGRGDLHARFEQLKAKLEAEGLFDPARKRPLPQFPRRIGVVTSPTAAAFQDVLNVLTRRYPLAEVVLSPTLVQGDEAPPQIVAALERINQAGVDVILLVRGGGSLEDLWAFNDETVARAVAASRTPVISGVGHEIDFTITDFVADRRVPTPSAAAEVATPYSVDDLRGVVLQLRERMNRAMHDGLQERRRNLERENRYLLSLTPRQRIATTRQRIDDLLLRSQRAMRQRIQLQRERVAALERALYSANPQTILERGYAIVETADGQTRLRRATDTAPGEALNVHFAQGSLRVTVETVDEE